MDTLQYIDDYYQGLFNAEEKKRFEQKILDDPSFAEEVTFYVSTILAAKELHNEEKKRRFREIYQQRPPTRGAISFRLNTLTKIALSVAASVIIVIGVYFIFFQHNQNPQQLADNYINTHLL